MSILEIQEGLLYQTSDEQLAYSITTTNWVSTPTSPAVVAYDINTGAVVTTTVFPDGQPSAPSGDVITLTLLKSLTKGHTYRIEVKFTVGSNVYECFFKVKCEL